MTGARTPSARTDNWLYAYGEVAGALELARRLVALGAGVVRTLTIDREALANAAGQGFTGAADLAEQLVLGGGVDYRTAYRIVARAVIIAGEGDNASLTLDDLARAARELGAGQVRVDSSVLAALDPRSTLATRTVLGGGSPERIHEHAVHIRTSVAEARRWERDRRLAAEEAETRLITAARHLARAP
jgi:argininosuccinate lyase